MAGDELRCGGRNLSTDIHVGQGTATAPTISNVPGSGAATFGGTGFTASVSTNGDGTKSITSSTTTVCAVGTNGLSVTYAGAGVHAHGTCGNGNQLPRSERHCSVSRWPRPPPPRRPSPACLPSGIFGGGFTATVSTNGDGTKSVVSNTPTVCSTNGLIVSYVGVGTCSLTAQVAAGTNYLAPTGCRPDLHDRAGHADHADHHQHPRRPPASSSASRPSWARPATARRR